MAIQVLLIEKASVNFQKIMQKSFLVRSL